jgi:catechol 2,3-dioxygenase
MSNIIHPDTTLGYVELTVTDLERSVTFYTRQLGMKLHRRDEGRADLGAGQADQVRLVENPQARRAPRTTGLYHFAILTPSRLELARALWRIAETQAPVQGFADHGVSEAIYLADPDGNGIEIYRDRPRTEWPYRNGELQMDTDPLDTDNLLAELSEPEEVWSGLHPDTVMGHMHLHVSNLREAENFYRTVIGFELIQYYGGSAAFLSAGGYHHHVGLNTWAGVGAPPPPADAVGLRWYVIHLPNEAALAEVAARVRRAGLPFEAEGAGFRLRDPSGNGLVLSTI